MYSATNKWTSEFPSPDRSWVKAFNKKENTTQIQPVTHTGMLQKKTKNSGPWVHTFRWVVEFGATPVMKGSERRHTHVVNY